jgi:hypothetical protein
MATTKQIPFRVPRELFERIELARGQVPREVWLRQAVEMRLGNRGPLEAHQPGPDVRNIRSSEQAKRDVAPIEKGKV